MKKFLLLATAAIIVGCSDNGASVPDDQFCYMRELTYSDVSSHPKYKQYRGMWNDGACMERLPDGNCIYWDHDFIMQVKECQDRAD